MGKRISYQLGHITLYYFDSLPKINSSHMTIKYLTSRTSINTAMHVCGENTCNYHFHLIFVIIASYGYPNCDQSTSSIHH